jgi:cytochrome b
VGYVVAGVVVLRLLWGLIGTPPARFCTWLPTPTGVVRYMRALMVGRAPRHLSHTPAGALMMLSIWTVILALAVTGWMSRLDPFWGENWPIDLHALLSRVLMAMVVIHVLAAVAMSVAHKENLIAAMVTGKKRGAKTRHEPD